MSETQLDSPGGSIWDILPPVTKKTPTDLLDKEMAWRLD